MASKRSSSPIELWQNEKKSCKDTDYLQRLVDKSVSSQMKMIENHVFKESLCQQLKAKHDKVDKNCLSWYNFAVEMRARVKRLVVILNRQQESINKGLKLKRSVKTANASVQTDDLASLPPLNCPLTPKTEEKAIKSDTMTIKEECTVDRSKKKVEAEHPAVFIDLTGNDDDSDQSSSIPQGPKPTNDMSSHSRPTSDVHCTKMFNSLGHKHDSSCMCATPSGIAVSTASHGRGSLLVEGTSSHKSLNTHSQTSKSCQRNALSLPYAPLPSTPLPPKNLPKGILEPPFQPKLTIRESSEGLELTWNHSNTSMYASMECYELFIYQHNPNNTNPSRWKKIKSDPIKAMPLPMACTLSQYSSVSKLYFAVRGKDVYGRYGNFSKPCSSSDMDV